MSFHKPCETDHTRNLTMNPYLRTLKRRCPSQLHPDFICWYNSCEELADWTIDPDITASINNTVFQEDKGCLDLTFPNALTRYATLAPVSNCGKHWGYWIRFVDNAPTVFMIFLSGTPGYYIRWYINMGKWAFRVKTATSQSEYTSEVAVIADTWYWMEVFYNIGIRFSFRINGVPVWNFSTLGQMGDFTNFLEAGYGVGVVHTLTDYLRLADRFEYPPS